MKNSMGLGAFIFIASWLVCAFGQPAWHPVLAFLASTIGYASICYLALQVAEPKKRFLMGFAWFAAVQAVQFFWLLSHPFLYIYSVYLFLLTLYGTQFGLLCLCITPSFLQKRASLLVLPSFWVLMEWSRLFILSGTSWNPLGLTMAGNPYTLQAASLLGVFGLSFWVVLTSLLLARRSYAVWIAAVLLPFVFGFAHIRYHDSYISSGDKQISALLVQTSFPIEETLHFPNRGDYINFVMDEWKKILSLIAPKNVQGYDFIALPEMVVPFGAYSPMYSHSRALRLFSDAFGPGSLSLLPKPEAPFADVIDSRLLVNNAFFAQGLANITRSNILVGMEDAEFSEAGEKVVYSGALFFQPDGDAARWPPSQRYEKRVLVPMGEYIPSKFLADLAKSYGIHGSFTAGDCAKSFDCGSVVISPSICYDETYGGLTRMCKDQGAQALVNLTSDVWFPHSMLVWQHMEHARLRTVESGVPLFRACNTGITCAIDSLGRTVKALGTESPDPEDIAEAMPVEVPLYHYQTAYSKVGDHAIVGFSFFVLLAYCIIALAASNRNRG